MGKMIKFNTNFFSDFSNSEFEKLFKMNLQKEVGTNVHYSQQMDFILKNFIKMINNETYISIDPETKQQKENNITKGLFIAGKTGTGKTAFVKSLFQTCKEMKIYCKVEGESTGYFFTPLNVINAKTISNNYYTNGAKPTEVGILCIDDLQRIESNYMGNKIDLFADIIEERYCINYTVTFATSNFPMQDKYFGFGSRVESRMCEMFAYYELNEKDYRKEM